MKLLLENWKKYLNENQKVWYHSGKIEGELHHIYLSDKKAALDIYYPGELYSFRINPDAKWINLNKIFMGPLAMISIETLGYNEKKIKMVRKAGYDVVWDRDDFTRGYRQIFVANPEVLIPVENKK